MSADAGRATVRIEPYAANIVRVTMSLDREYAMEGPGPGMLAEPASEGWLAGREANGDTFRSSRLVVTDPAKWPDSTAMNRDLHAMQFHTTISV